MSRPSKIDPSVNVALQYPAGRQGAPAPTRVRVWVGAVLRRVDNGVASVCIRFVDAEEGRALNRHYRQRDQATNVLSFPAQALPGLPAHAMHDDRTLGDLVVCVPVVTREASEQGKALGDHYAHMIVHGLLHLLGYDHIEEADAERMESREREILASLGIADPYAAG